MISRTGRRAIAVTISLDLLHKSPCPARIRNPGLLQSDSLPSQTEDHSRRASSYVCEGRQSHLKSPALPVQGTYAIGLLKAWKPSKYRFLSLWIEQMRFIKTQQERVGSPLFRRRSKLGVRAPQRRTLVPRPARSLSCPVPLAA